MIINIFGVTFLIEENSLTKILGIYQFYDSLYDPLYVFAFHKEKIILLMKPYVPMMIMGN